MKKNTIIPINNTVKKREKRKKLFLESLKKGVSILKASKAADIDYSTIWVWRKKSKAFDNKVLSVLESRTQIVEDALYMNALRHNVTAQIFWLKNRGKERWKDVYKADFSDIKVKFQLVGGRDQKLIEGEN